MDVRPCSERDLELLRAHWPTPDDVAGAHYAEQHTGAATFLVAWEAVEPWGWALIQWHGCVGDNAKAAFPHSVEINHLQVRPEHQGRGTGTAILAAAEERAGDRGVSQIAVSVSIENTDADRLYRRLGYQPTGVVDICCYRWCDAQGEWHDETESSELLIKRLQDENSPR